MQDLEILTNSYLIIGGHKSKKSEVSLYLSKELGYKLINLDREKHAYFDDFTDFDSTKYYNLLDIDQEKAINYIHKYEMKHLKFVLDNISENVIIDFGNTYTLINEKEIINKLKLFKYIIYLKQNEDVIKESDYINKKLYNNKINSELATISINIEDKDINNIIKEIFNYKEFKDIL